MQCPTCTKDLPGDHVFCTWCECYTLRPHIGTKAGLIRRWLASMIDPALLALAILVPAGLAGAADGESRGGVPLAILTVMPIAAGFLFMFSRGTTPGKYVLNEQVVDKLSGTQPTFGTMFVRESIGKLVSAAFLGLGFLWAIWDRDSQAWHDKIARTVVVSRPNKTHPREHRNLARWHISASTPGVRGDRSAFLTHGTPDA